MAKQTVRQPHSTNVPLALPPTQRFLPVLLLLFVGSGCAALIYEIVWFQLIQLVIGLRWVLLLLDAREANGLVSGILNVSQLFVAPFEGILRTDALHSAGSTFDVTAIVALVGWTILEIVVLWAVGIFRGRQTT